MGLGNHSYWLNKQSLSYSRKVTTAYTNGCNSHGYPFYKSWYISPAAGTITCLAVANQGSSFSFLNMGTSGRSVLTAEGHADRPSVARGNLLAIRPVAVLTSLCFFLQHTVSGGNWQIFSDMQELPLGRAGVRPEGKVLT